MLISYSEVDMKDKALREIQLLKCERKYKEAIDLAQLGFKTFKDNCFLNEIVEAYIVLKDRKSAINILLKMIKTEKDNPHLYQRLGYNYFILGDFKKALKYYKMLLNMNPEVSSYNFNVGNMYHFLKDLKNAYKYYDIAVKLDITNLSALNNLGLVYYETKNWQEAIKIFNTAISISATHPEAYHHLGIIYREFVKDFELSELYLKKAIRLDPTHFENTYQLALTYKEENNIEQLKSTLNKCLEMRPNHKESLKLLKQY